MIGKFLAFFKKEYKTLNRIEISKDNLLHNYKYLTYLNRKLKIAPVLKGNAYGHGIVEVARILDPLGAPFFCVDSLYEAYELYKASIKTPILIMGYTDPQNLKVKKLPFSYAVFNLEMLPILNKYQSGCGIHIFVDTGMHREGISLEELPIFLNHLKQYPNLKVEGIMSHLTSADDPKDKLNSRQINNFKKMRKIIRKAGFKPKWMHIQNSDGLALHPRGANVNMARIGLALYGISSDPNLKPVLTLRSKIIQIKKLKKGDRVGYGGTFTAKGPELLGVLPLGYYDGLDRRLSNIGWVNADGIHCKIIGRVSMNITTIDISKVPNPFIGQEVVVFSNNPKDKNSIENAARLCKTIPYDILIHLAQSTKRVII